MHAVEDNNVIEKANPKAINTSEQSSYTSILNSALNSTKRKRYNDSSNRFFYSVGGLNFLFETNLKVENLSDTTINKVPHAPEWCSGIISVRGVIIPVVNMHILFKDEIKNSKTNIKHNKKPHLLMIEHENHVPLILQIDKLPEIINIKDYTYSKSADNSPNWQGKTWENSTNKLFEINHDILFNTIKTL
jgi:chemotaxis signal transduction protein